MSSHLSIYASTMGNRKFPIVHCDMNHNASNFNKKDVFDYIAPKYIF